MIKRLFLQKTRKNTKKRKNRKIDENTKFFQKILQNPEKNHQKNTEYSRGFLRVSRHVISKNRLFLSK